MHLIADSGSTKTNWVLLSGANIISRFGTIGFNPNYLTTKDITDGFKKELIPKLEQERTLISKVWFYGAGCSGGANDEKMGAALKYCLPSVDFEINSDLLAATRSLCGNTAGIACILGTGSNSCLYDGQKITEHIPPLGIIFGDDGSGSELGKRLVKAYFQKGLSDHICQKFEQQFTSDRNTILKEVYASPTPNRYLAGYARFVAENADDPGLRQIITTCFKDFIESSVTRYSGYKSYPVHFTGSIAFHFREIIIDLLKTYKLRIGRITSDPMDDLIEFHKNLEG